MDYAVKEKVRATLERLHKEGKDIFEGFYSANNGDVILTATKAGDTVNACYCYYNQMYNYSYPIQTIIPQ